MGRLALLLGLLIALLVVWLTQKNGLLLNRGTFQTLVLISIIPGILAVVALAFGTRDVAVTGTHERPRISFRDLGKPFWSS